ncbi:MAG: NAD-dependent epimerase/dehydratase family protein [Alphaproteobacteria bacterium]
MAKYLVTGGCGFIGSHLADALLEAGHDVRILDDLSTGKLHNAPPAAELTIGDASDPMIAFRAMAGMDACFHLAAVASVERANDHWFQTHRINLSATIGLMEAAKAHGQLPFVYASSAAVYGDNPATPLQETAETRPLTAYGADKFGCELHARVAGGVHAVPTAGLRFFNVYGARQDPKSPYSGVISIFCDRLAAGLPITIFGDGGQERDFIHVSDVVRRLIDAMAAVNIAAPVFNVCTGRPTTVAGLAEIIGSTLGMTPEISHGPERISDIRRSLGDPSHATSVLGALATMTLVDGLARTINSEAAVAAA